MCSLKTKVWCLSINTTVPHNVIPKNIVTAQLPLGHMHWAILWTTRHRVVPLIGVSNHTGGSIVAGKCLGPGPRVDKFASFQL